MIQSAPEKPAVASRKLPRKKPAPLSAFLEPVRMATHLKSVPLASGGTSTLIALLELILVRSFAMPESACETITHATEANSDHSGLSNASIPSAATCSARPATSVTRNPIREAIQPPSKFVTMPKNS
jgi:hypothetical protein